MTSKPDTYRLTLRKLKSWTPYLLKNSGLPGPRGNLELAQVVAEEASNEQIEEFLSLSVDKAAENTPEVFLIFCGLTALGKLAGRADKDEHTRHKYFIRLRAYASDPRWRVREAVAIALQYVGDVNMGVLLSEMGVWCEGNWYEKRAVAAALAEPRLLKDNKIAAKVLQILDRITVSIDASTVDSHNEAFKVLRKSMGYCWSVAVAALPKNGKHLMEKWLVRSNSDIRWIIKENLGKNRLVMMDAGWVAACSAKLAAAV